MALTSGLVQRTWTVLEEKGIPYQYVEVHLATEYAIYAGTEDTE